MKRGATGIILTQPRSDVEAAVSHATSQGKRMRKTLEIIAVVVVVTCVIGIGVIFSSGPARDPGAYPADAQPEASTQSGRTREHNVSADPEAPGHRF